MDNEYNALDDNWIYEFEKTDKLYQDFYKDDLYYVNLRVIYINCENQINKIKNESLLLTHKNTISCEELIRILKTHTIDDHKKYSLLSILKYNITLEPDDLKNYLLKDGENIAFLNVIKHIDDIKFDKSITMFHDLNDLILILYEKPYDAKAQNSSSFTKKIYMHPSAHKKTIKKRYKDYI